MRAIWIAGSLSSLALCLAACDSGTDADMTEPEATASAYPDAGAGEMGGAMAPATAVPPPITGTGATPEATGAETATPGETGAAGATSGQETPGSATP